MGYALLNAIFCEGKLYPTTIESDVVASVSLRVELSLIGEAAARGDVGDFFLHAVSMARHSGNVKGLGPVVTLVHTARGGSTLVLLGILYSFFGHEIVFLFTLNSYEFSILHGCSNSSRSATHTRVEDYISLIGVGAN